MESLRVLCNFKLDTLDEAWVRAAWNAEFVTYEEPPDDYLEYLESDSAKSVLRRSCRILKTWIKANREQEEQEEEEEKGESEFSWQSLMMLDINVQGLVAVLDYIMKVGRRVGTEEASRQAGLTATSLYLMLLTVPGSNAFGVYHPNLYERVMDMLKMAENIFSSSLNNTKETDAGNDDDRSDHCMLSCFEKLSIVEGVTEIISDLITMLQSFRLRNHADSLKTTVRTLLSLTKLEMLTKLYNNDNKLDSVVSGLSKVAYKALTELCNSNHGSITVTTMLIAQCMMPYLMVQHSNNQQARLMTVVQESSICFLKNLLEDDTKKATQAVVTLVHQLMVSCPERVEGRQKQAVIVIKLLNIFNKNITLNVFKDVMLFSFNSKISYRLFAQEIVGKLLIESPLSHDNLDEDTKLKMRKILVAVVLSRCTDRSPLVRGKAMATFASFSDCENSADQSILEDVFKIVSVDKQLLTFDNLMKTLSENTDPLPGSNALITMLLERVNDERALVRRSSLKILQNLCIMFPSVMERMLHAITERCRDPMLMVRQFAVQVLSAILKQFPHESKLLHEWVQAVMPQIYDIESKVQEKVLECLQDILIDRITCASTYNPNDANSLPWKMLDKLSSMRMRKHLSKACSMWVKNGVITKPMISNLQSHLNAENSIGAWILLAALAENTKIPKIELYIADYKDVICKNDFHTSLVLHVIRHAYSCLNRNYLEDFYQHLHKCICHFQIKFNLISVCLDIISGVLRHLHFGNNVWVETCMTELIKLSETELQNMLKEDEGDMQDTLKIRAIFTLGHASLLCTDRISPSSLQILRKLLLNRESLSQTMREMKGLQTSAVVLLCQQALRDREIAKKVTPIFGELMRQETDSPEGIAVKINVAKALADICVRFTALVEPYLSDMCISMKNPNPAVREAIVVIFIQLLLEDFIKMKGPFFFHILTMLSDPDNMIRELTVFLVEERLLKKNKTLISQQFLESIYYYNNYYNINTSCSYRMQDEKKKLLTLPGKENQEKRNVIYEFMLDHLDPPAKFNLIVKLTKYILCEICDGTSINVTKEEGMCVLQDTLFIMSNDRLHLSVADKHTDDTQELDETANPSQPSTNNNIIGILAELKKHHLDSLLPTLIRLKEKLNALKLPLKSNVEKMLYKIYSTYNKDHLLSLLNEYPELEKDMDNYPRRSKDKIASESDDDVDSRAMPMTPTKNYKDSLQSASKQTPTQALHSSVPSTSWAADDTNGRLSPNSDHPQVPSPFNKIVKEVSIHLERLSLTGLSMTSESTFSTSTPKWTRHLKAGTNYSSTCILKIKRPSSVLGVSSSSSPRKISRRSMSRW